MTIKRNLQRNNAPQASVQSVSSGLEMGMSLRVILPAGRSKPCRPAQRHVPVAAHCQHDV